MNLICKAARSFHFLCIVSVKYDQMIRKYFNLAQRMIFGSREHTR